MRRHSPRDDWIIFNQHLTSGAVIWELETESLGVMSFLCSTIYTLASVCVHTWMCLLAGVMYSSRGSFDQLLASLFLRQAGKSRWNKVGSELWACRYAFQFYKLALQWQNITLNPVYLFIGKNVRNACKWQAIEEHQGQWFAYKKYLCSSRTLWNYPLTLLQAGDQMNNVALWHVLCIYLYLYRGQSGL